MLWLTPLISDNNVNIVVVVLISIRFQDMLPFVRKFLLKNEKHSILKNNELSTKNTSN